MQRVEPVKEKIPFSAIVIGVTLLLLMIFVFIDLEKSEDPLIWKKNLEKIEYTTEDNSYALFENESVLKKRWFVEFNGIRRRGSGNVQNIFRDFETLKHSGSYAVADETPGKQDFCVKFFENEDGEPVAICAHEKTPANLLMVTVDSADFENQYFLIQPYMMTRFQIQPENLIERRLLISKAGSKTKQIRIISEEEKLVLNLETVENEEGKKVDQYIDDDSDTEIPLNLARTLENYIKQVNIDKYPEELEKNKDLSIKSDAINIQIRIEENSGQTATEEFKVGKNADGQWVVHAPGIILNNSLATVPEQSVNRLKRQFDSIVEFKQSAPADQESSENP